jgi:HD superfamily phosphohydrolase YqeK
MNQSDQIISILQERIEADVCSPMHLKSWVSGGELFYLKHDSTKVSEVSSTKSDGLSFLFDFDKSIQLIAFGILNCQEIWSWCFTKVDLSHMMTAGDKCSKYSLITTANDLLQHKLFGLTAAGIKHDFPKFMPYQYSIEEEDEETLDGTPHAKEQFLKWLNEAGEYYMTHVKSCFVDNVDFHGNGILMTMDDGLNFNVLHNKLFLVPAVDGKQQTTSCDADGSHHDEEYKAGTEEDNNQQEYEGEDVIGESTEEEEEEEESDDDKNDNEHDDDDSENCDEQGELHDYCGTDRGEILQEINEENILDDQENMFQSLFPFGTPSTYPVLLQPSATTFHSGKIKCKIIVNTDSSSAGNLHVIGTINRNNGEAVGCQGYLTSVKNLKGAAMFRKLSKVGQIEKACFGLLHSSLENEAAEFTQLMNECLEQLEHLDYSKVATSDILSWCFCFRLECFRAVLELQRNSSDDLHQYPIKIIDMPVWIGHKDKILRNYCRLLNHAKEVVMHVFQGDAKVNRDNYLDPRTLSPFAKMGIQFLSEILALDIGTPSGFSRQGPIIQSLVSTNHKMTTYGLHYPTEGIELEDFEKSFTGLSHGLDPNLWKFSTSEYNLHDDICRALGYNTQTAGNSRNCTNLIPALELNTGLVDKVRKQLGRQLFRFQKQNKDKDRCTWQIFASQFLMVAAGNSRNDNVLYRVFLPLQTKDAGFQV